MLLEGIDWRMPARKWRPAMTVQAKKSRARVNAPYRQSVQACIPMLPTPKLPEDVKELKLLLFRRETELVEE